MSNEVFISYSSREYDKANFVKKALQNSGISCWMAPDSIPAGSNYAVEIPKGIKSCKIFILILSEDAQKSIWVSREVEQALNEKKIIVPFQIEDCKLNDAFNFYLSQVQRISAYIELQSALNNLVKIVKTTISLPDENASDKNEINKISSNGINNRVIETVKFAISSKNYQKANEILLNTIVSGTNDYYIYILKAMIDMQLENDGALFEDMENIMKLEKTNSSEKMQSDIKELLDYRGKNGVQVLHIATFHENFKLVKFCVEHGANVNSRAGIKNVTPIGIMFVHVNKNTAGIDGTPFKRNKENVKNIRKYLLDNGAKDKIRFGY